ncbi:hypothetical protein N7495_004801 [Penicillium taxi]|uniref:uncharacterized protein n=1 Tax=Penicillium taxi TaxID=168475 RepID=UPI0025455B47|nr:uncharacterized protein N7495_004801 [Penicillium taxi]KAJ5900057.1 hypothetical protein N7495_004801 [Penicillium taxi]
MNWSLLRLLVAAGLAAAFAMHDSCKIIESKIPGRISYSGTTTYNSSLSSYYSSQERSLSSSRIFRPTNTSEVSRFIKLVTLEE